MLQNRAKLKWKVVLTLLFAILCFMQLLQISLVSKQPSSLTLSRRSLLKSHIHLNHAKINQVQYKEVATPSQLSPIKCSDQSFNPVMIKSPIYADTTDIQLDDISAFQHYSVDATACLVSSHCNTLNFTGVDLSKAGQLDSVEEGNGNYQGEYVSNLKSTAVDSIDLSEREDSGVSQDDSVDPESASDCGNPVRPRLGSVSCMSCGYAPRTLDFYPQCCQSPAYKQGAQVIKPCPRSSQAVILTCDCDDSLSLSSRGSCDGEEDFISDFQDLACVLDFHDAHASKQNTFI